MKLGLARVMVLVVLSVLVWAGAARASPPRASAANAREDALADGDVDADDIASTLLSGSGGRDVVGAARGSIWVSLLGFSRRTLDERQETGGFVLVGLPLDRIARASTRARSLPRAEDHLDLVTVADAPARGAEPFEIALTPRVARACVTAAWRAAGLGADDARLDAIVSRARWSAVLPEARLRAVRFEDARLSLDTSTDTSRLRDSAGANVGFEARLTWRLDRLLYADDEPSFERIRLEQRDARTRVGARVLEALFHWQRAALDLRTLPPTQLGTRDEADVRLRLIEAEAALDVLTNGWFGTHRPQLARGVLDGRPLGRSGASEL